MCSNVRSNYTILSDKLATDTPLYESFLSSLPAVRTRARNISAIVCYRDKPEFTFTCISKLRQFNPDIVIIAVDHNSTPCPLLKRAEECADHTIQYDGPYNYSLMNNLGISFSLKNYPDNHILLVNNDVFVIDSTIDYLYSSLELNDVLVVGSLFSILNLMKKIH